MRNNQRGFTLIEIMIVVVILGIIASIALPNYQEYVRKGNRTEAKSALLEAAQALERYYSVNGTYLSGSALASVYKTSVPPGGTALYTIAVVGTPTADTYTLQASRAGTMGGDPCGNYRISHTGVKTLDGASKSLAECW